MRAYEIRDGFGLDNLVMTERSEPAPGPGEVLIRLRAVSLNYRDLLVVKGVYNPKMPLPRIPVSDGAGVVTAVLVEEGGVVHGTEPFSAGPAARAISASLPTAACRRDFTVPTGIFRISAISRYLRS